MSLVYLVASGDLRLSANQVCWPAQLALETLLLKAVESFGFEVRRAHSFQPEKQHGFIDSQRYGMDVFREIPAGAPVIVAEAVWQYSHHVLAGLYHHDGPILTAANWSGQWPGLVGMLNLNASLTKAGVAYSTIWSKDFTDEYSRAGLEQWLHGKRIRHDASHVKRLAAQTVSGVAGETGHEVAAGLLRDKAILGVFDEGCMGMYNAIIPDELLHPMGIFKERLSQSALYAAMRVIPAEEAQAVRDWLGQKGMKFETGPDGAIHLTEEQILDQCRMYIAALRIADQFGCAAIGIQYQQGLKDLAPASDLVEGLLNNVDRPPVRHASEDRVLYEGECLPHFNEVDECAGVDALVTNRVWRKLQLDPETTLHDIRFGEEWQGQFVWVFEISGAVPPQHLVGGYQGATSERQPPMYFPLGGGTLKGISKPGEIVWSRVYVEDGRLKADMGRGTVLDLPREEVNRRWQLTTPQWPIMNVVLHGVTRDQMMGRHKSNHVQVAYTKDGATATTALMAKAAAFHQLGIEVYLCGVEQNASSAAI
ncbi:fucose isomerase [Acidipila rosea]|uniref:L-fucose isomerase-like protein n=1 Tax=Acidipila rosea TaxID=768535 RepID=A0A4V2PVT4_9BACT|nr:fucose isomerase [Acidipila rosea]TCK75621.1 L-fucose isomerase-like protein [Acidipila rosea]